MGRDTAWESNPRILWVKGLHARREWGSHSIATALAGERERVRRRLFRAEKTRAAAPLAEGLLRHSRQRSLTEHAKMVTVPFPSHLHNRNWSFLTAHRDIDPTPTNCHLVTASSRKAVPRTKYVLLFCNNACCAGAER